MGSFLPFGGVNCKAGLNKGTSLGVEFGQSIPTVVDTVRELQV